MLSGHKILVTGPAGQIAFPLAETLAKDNEVWGIARFTVPGSRERCEAIGVRTVTGDLGSGELDELPTDFEYVLHLAADQSGGYDYDSAIRNNAEATGLLLAHCRKAKAALVMSTHSVYKPVEDPLHVFRETDPLGDVNSSMSPPYSMSKIAQEAVARTCARLFDLPVIIARMNASYGPNGGLPAYHADAVIAGQPVVTRWDPCPYSLIHEDDIIAQTEGLLDAASTSTTIVNWAGDEAVSVQEWTAYLGELSGRPAQPEVVSTPGTLRGSIADVSRRRAYAGPCTVSWKDGLRQTFEARRAAAGSDAQ
jgi:nucleoside-diphosphate-sugar epimerase